MSKDAVRRHDHQPIGIASASVALLTVAVWGGNPVAVQFCLDSMPPIAIAAARFAMAAVFMLVWCGIAGDPLTLTRRQWKPSLIAGGLLFAQISLFNIGVAWSSSSHATLLINTFIFWVVIFDYVSGGVRLNAVRVAGLGLAAAGAGLALTSAGASGAELVQQDAPSLAGDAVTLLSALVLGVKIVYTKKAVRIVPPGTLILWHDIVGVGLFVATSLMFEPWRLRVDAPAALGLVYQGVFVAGLCFVLQAMLLRRHSASQIAVFSFATPLVGVTAAVLLRGDQLSALILAAGILVAGGILLVNLPERQTPK